MPNLPDKRTLYANANAYAESEDYLEYIQRYFYDSTSLAYGHTMDTHYRKSDSYLKKRCIQQGLTGATAFLPDRFHSTSDIARYIREKVLLDDDLAHEISLWLYMTDSEVYNIIIEDPNGETIGYGYLNSIDHEWRNGPLFTTRLCVVFKRLRGRGFVIETAYPYLIGMDDDA